MKSLRWLWTFSLLLLTGCFGGTGLEDMLAFGKTKGEVTSLIQGKKLAYQLLNDREESLDPRKDPQEVLPQVASLRCFLVIGEVECQLDYGFDDQGRNQDLRITPFKAKTPSLGALKRLHTTLQFKLEGLYGRIPGGQVTDQLVWTPEGRGFQAALRGTPAEGAWIFQDLRYRRVR